MTVREFLKTTNVVWSAVIFYTDEGAYYENNIEEGEPYSVIEFIPEDRLDSEIKFWDVEVFIINESDCDIFIEILVKE